MEELTRHAKEFGFYPESCEDALKGFYIGKQYDQVYVLECSLSSGRESDAVGE